MLVLDAFEQSLTPHVAWLSGPAIGRVPEASDPLRIYSPFSLPLRTKLRALGGRPRGATTTAIVIGVDAIPSLSVERLRGALISEEGVEVRTFTARTERPDALAAPARFKLGDDHAWGLIRMTKNIVNFAVVGGGIGTHDFWQDLELIRVEGWQKPLLAGELDPITAAETDLLWQLPRFSTYPQSSDRSAFVLRPMGPVRDLTVPVWLGDRWEKVRVFQSPTGVTQLLVANDVAPSVLAAHVPMAA
jgi:hypothetical protein